MLFFWTFYSSKNPKINTFSTQKYEAAQLFFNINNNKKCFFRIKSLFNFFIIIIQIWYSKINVMLLQKINSVCLNILFIKESWREKSHCLHKNNCKHCFYNLRQQSHSHGQMNFLQGVWKSVKLFVNPAAQPSPRK